uniref:Uncharacterized protein n=1 Tax=Oryza glumipatula TaxID=40148 RepID=A0A0D9Z3K7_9ORYZ
MKRGKKKEKVAKSTLEDSKPNSILGGISTVGTFEPGVRYWPTKKKCPRKACDTGLEPRVVPLFHWLCDASPCRRAGGDFGFSLAWRAGFLTGHGPNNWTTARVTGVLAGESIHLQQ